jgi:radical SAM protein with 4Fe4S-binding SPASM domain
MSAAGGTGKVMHSRKQKLKILRYKYLWRTRRPYSTNAPVALNLEPTNRCNLRCRFCSFDPSREMGDMDWDFFTRTVDQAAAIGVVSINLYLSGEPLLNPRTADMAAYAHAKGLFTYLHTNAVLLTRKVAAALIDSGLDSISFSFDGEDRENYEKNRVGAKYAHTLENIIGFLKMKQEKGKQIPYARIQIIRDAESAAEISNPWEVTPEFRSLFAGLPLDGFHVIPPFNLRGEKTDISLFKEKNYFPCFQLWAGLSVAWNGKVVGCCADLNARHIIGDLNKQSILDVWNTPELRDMRTKLIEGKYKEVPLCSQCSYLWTDEQSGFRPVSFAASMIKDMVLNK